MSTRHPHAPAPAPAPAAPLINARFKSAIIQAIRYFIVGFIAVYPASQLIGAASGSQPLDLHALRAAAVAGLIAAGGFIYRFFVDPLPVPTLADRPVNTVAPTTLHKP